MKHYELRNNVDGTKADYLSLLDIGEENGCLKAVFTCHHSDMWSAGNKYNDPIYNGDVVELFIYTGVKGHYIEIEVAPNNTHFVGDIENEDRSPKLTLMPNDIIESKIEATDFGYVATIFIPLEKLGCDKKIIRFNAYRIDTDGGNTNAHLIALNPTMCGSFHVRSSVCTPLE